MIVTLQEAKQHLRVDSNDDDIYISLLINATEEFITNMTGKTFNSTNNLAKTLCLLMIGDLYERRSMVENKVGEKISGIVNMILIQLGVPDGGETS
jgi:uncharacterized phage protein (predicted DNA packaging)